MNFNIYGSSSKHFFRRLLTEKVKCKLTMHEEADIQEKRNALRRRITLYFEVAKLYMPTLYEVAPKNPSATSVPSEKIPLRLPSSLPANLRASVCLYRLPDKERRLRLAQAEDSLSDLRRQLRITMGLWQYKVRQIGSSQRSGTRARTLIDRFKLKTAQCAARYRAARAALVALDPGGHWTTYLHELQDGDIKSPGKGDDEAEGTRTLSWIWMGNRTGDATSLEMSEDDINESEFDQSFIYNIYTLTSR